MPTKSKNQTKKKEKRKKKKRKNKKKSKSKRGSWVDDGGKYVLTIDLGTTGVRSLLVGEDGYPHPTSRAYNKIVTLTDHPTHAEQDPEDVWEKTLDVMKQTIEGAGIEPDRIAALGLSTQRGSIILWDRTTGEAVHNCLTWQDTRTENICKKWNKAMITRSVRAVTSIAYPLSKDDKMGLGSNFTYTSIHSTPRIYWTLQLKKAQKVLKRGDLVFGTMDTWILFKLTGGRVHATDFSNISATGLWQPFDMDWNPLVFRISKLPKGDFLPRVLPSQCIEYECMDEELLGHAIPIRAVISDQSASAFAQGCTNTGSCKITLGTGGFVSVCTGKNPKFSKSGMVPLIAWMLQEEDTATFFVEGNSKAIGSVVSWAMNSMELFHSVKETSEIALSVSNTQGVYFVPSFNGFGPPLNCEGRGLILGLTTTCSKAHLVRALLEGIAFTISELVNVARQDMNKLFTTSELRIDGGVAQNNFVCQFIADITNMKVIRSIHLSRDMTALGASYIAGTASDIGLWTKSDLERFRKEDTIIFEPDMDEDVRSIKLKEWRIAVSKAKANK